MNSSSYATHPWEHIYELPTDEAVAKFMDLRGEYLANKEQQLQNERQDAIKFASKAEKGLQEIRGINYLYRAGFMARILLPMRHSWTVYKYFPGFQSVIHDSYPLTPEMSKQETEDHLDELERLLKMELDAITGTPSTGQT